MTALAAFIAFKKHMDLESLNGKKLDKKEFGLCYLMPSSLYPFLVHFSIWVSCTWSHRKAVLEGSFACLC